MQNSYLHGEKNGVSQLDRLYIVQRKENSELCVACCMERVEHTTQYKERIHHTDRALYTHGIDGKNKRKGETREMHALLAGIIITETTAK